MAAPASSWAPATRLPAPVDYSDGDPAVGSRIVPNLSAAEQDQAMLPPPVFVVTHPSQLPSEFLQPDPEHHISVGFDCEGVDLCRHGRLCVMQVGFPCHALQI